METITWITLIAVLLVTAPSLVLLFIGFREDYLRKQAVLYHQRMANHLQRIALMDNDLWERELSDGDDYKPVPTICDSLFDRNLIVHQGINQLGQGGLLSS